MDNIVDSRVWDKVKILGTVTNSLYRKCQESANTPSFKKSHLSTHHTNFTYLVSFDQQIIVKIIRLILRELSVFTTVGISLVKNFKFVSIGLSLMSVFWSVWVHTSFYGVNCLVFQALLLNLVVGLNFDVAIFCYYL